LQLFNQHIGKFLKLSLDSKFHPDLTPPPTNLKISRKYKVVHINPAECNIQEIMNNYPEDYLFYELNVNFNNTPSNYIKPSTNMPRAKILRYSEPTASINGYWLQTLYKQKNILHELCLFVNNPDVHINLGHIINNNIKTLKTFVFHTDLLTNLCPKCLYFKHKESQSCPPHTSNNVNLVRFFYAGNEHTHNFSLLQYFENLTEFKVETDHIQIDICANYMDIFIMDKRVDLHQFEDLMTFIEKNIPTTKFFKMRLPPNIILTRVGTVSCDWCYIFDIHNNDENISGQVFMKCINQKLSISLVAIGAYTEMYANMMPNINTCIKFVIENQKKHDVHLVFHGSFLDYLHLMPILHDNLLNHIFIHFYDKSLSGSYKYYYQTSDGTSLISIGRSVDNVVIATGAAGDTLKLHIEILNYIVNDLSLSNQQFTLSECCINIEHSKNYASLEAIYFGDNGNYIHIGIDRMIDN